MTREPWNDFGPPTEPKPTAARTVLILMGLSAALIAAVLLIWSVQKARAHSAPTGWNYPDACCSGMDCREVPASAISEKPDGYVVPSGEVVGYHDKRVKDSPDGQTHWCSQGGSDTGRTICLFIPPRSF